MFDLQFQMYYGIEKDITEQFNEWAQKYNVVKIKSNYISFNDNTEKDTYEVLVKNY